MATPTVWNWIDANEAAKRGDAKALDRFRIEVPQVPSNVTPIARQPRQGGFGL